MSEAVPVTSEAEAARPAPGFLDFLNTDPYADNFSAPKNQNERIHIDNIVNPSMLHAHLALMKKFKALEQPNEKVDLRYILRAQKRYLIWLKVLQQREFTEENLPIPPIDVCYIWHVHALSPLWYSEDMSRLHDLAELNYNFPLAVLHKVWERTGGNHVDDYSERVWHKHTRLPWVLDPDDDSDFSLTCIDCNKILRIPWLEYVNIYRTPKYKTRCPHCSAELSSGTLSAKRFLKDIRLFLRNRRNYIGGSLLDLPSGRLSKAAAQDDCSILFKRSSAHVEQLIDNTLPWSTVCKWPYIIDSIKRRLTELDQNDELRNVREGIINRIVFAYMDNPAPFSLDLVSAILRQRHFIHKMVANRWINSAAVQAQATTRYHKFLLLQNEQKGTTCFVPTLDIDLVWHTHILYSRHYREYTYEKVGRIIDHNDMLPKPTLSDSFGATSRAWYKRYHEPYTQEDPSEYWFTTKRKVMAAFIPPYAVWVSHILKKYRKGTSKERREYPREDSRRHCNCEKQSETTTMEDNERSLNYAGSCGMSGNSTCGEI